MAKVGASGLPFDDRRAPGQAGAENHQQDQVAPLDPPGRHRLVEGNGDGSGGGVAVLVQVDEDLLGLGAEAFADGINDAPVGLVGDDALDPA